MNIIRTLLNFIYPPRCCVCTKLIGMFAKDELCDECKNTLGFVGTDHDFSKTIRDEFKDKVYFDGGGAVFEYKAVKKSMESFKYFGERSLGSQYAKLMFEYFKDSKILTESDCIVSVPLNIKRLKSRGYDQAEFLAKEFAKLCKKEFIPNAVVRNRDTKPQNALNPKERLENVKNAFSLGNADVKGRKIIIIDDIFTTGSTINECAAVLKSAGAEKVNFLAFAAAGNIRSGDKNV